MFNEMTNISHDLKLICNLHSLLFQVFRRFVEVGRVAYIATGRNKGKLCVIVDVIDQRRVKIFICEFYHLCV